MKKYVKFITIFILIAVVVGVGAYNYRRNSAYTVVVKLTPEQRSEYEGIVERMNKKIAETRPPEKPDIDFFIEKARYLEYLGGYGAAIDTLLDSFRYYENTSAGWNNIAKLYDKVGNYKAASLYYKKLIQHFNLYRYYGELAWDYYYLGMMDEARESYGRYAQLAHGQDEKLYNLLYVQNKPN